MFSLQCVLFLGSLTLLRFFATDLQSKQGCQNLKKTRSQEQKSLVCDRVRSLNRSDYNLSILKVSPVLKYHHKLLELGSRKGAKVVTATYINDQSF